MLPLMRSSCVKPQAQHAAAFTTKLSPAQLRRLSCKGNRARTHAASVETPQTATPETTAVQKVERKQGNARVVYQSWQQESGKKLPGATIVITGGSQGVGRQLAINAAKNGFNVVIASRNPEQLEAAGNMITSSRSSNLRVPGVMAVSVDITNEEAVKGMAALAGESFEEISVLFNNAGVCGTGGVEDTPIEATRQLMEINYTGHVITTQALLPALRESAYKAKIRQGSPGANVPKPAIVMVNSFAARIPLKNMSAYTASKFALAGWTDVLRDELRDGGIFVATVNPGVIKSNFLERAQWYGKKGESARESMNNMMQQAQGIVQTPEEVAAAAFECAMKQQQEEVNVGPAFNGAINLYRLTGVNPFAMVP